MSNGVSTTRRSGTRESGSISRTRSAASGPATARAWRTASRRRSSRRAAPSSNNARQSECGGPKRSTVSTSVSAGAGRSASRRREHEAHALRVGERLAKDDALTPRAALHEARGKDYGTQRAPAPLATREQAIDQQAERAAELLARAGLWQLELLAEQLPGTARAKRRVLAPREVVGEQAGTPEAVGDRTAGQRGEAPERRDPELLEGLDERRDLGTAAQQRDRMGREIRHARDPPGAPDARVGSRDERTEAGRSLPDPRPRQNPAQMLGAGREISLGEHLDDPAGVQTLKTAGVEAGLPRAQRLDLGAEPLESCERELPRLGHAHRIGRHERQARAARQRLPHPHPGVDPVCLGGPRDRADEQLASGLRRQRSGLAEQPRPAARGDGELEALQQDAEDRHTNRCSQSIRDGRKAGAPRVAADSRSSSFALAHPHPRPSRHGVGTMTRPGGIGKPRRSGAFP